MPIHNMNELRKNQKEHMNQLSNSLLMIGTMLQEFDMEGANTKAYDYNHLQDINQVNDVLGVRNVEECTQKYFSDLNSGKFDPGYEMLSQAQFMTSSLLASAQSQAGGEVYLYQFDYPAHAQHADDIYYVMGVSEHPMDANEKWLGRVFPLYFTNFIKGFRPAPDWKPLNPKVVNYFSINKSLVDGVVPGMKLGYHDDLSIYYGELMEFDEQRTLLKKETLNDPIQLKELVLVSEKSFTILNLLFYSAILGVILFSVFKVQKFHQNRQRDYEKC
ncbi:hypothetical protein PENTCL1PPCAC_919 [Pristionchus entomophagus]|uniref:Carboxylesterase type B domain-containing protein n=1 Tax=Pristionchus entomophagus TaxID=358040 RepID=A0AAV5SFC6_9BILA|nr:hypothetical protein PENTCL1PPCAC_919 [Pristionchus entomophagus]